MKIYEINSLVPSFRGWFRSSGINLLIFVIIATCTDMSYETNDDYAIAQLLNAGYSNIGFINVFLCKMLSVMQSIFDDINVFVLFQIIMSFFCFVIMLKILLDTTKSLIWIFCCSLVIFIFSVDHYYMIQFTKTSMLLLITGAFIFLDVFTSDRERRRWLWVGILLFYFGAWLRFTNVIVATGFLVVYLAIRIIHDLAMHKRHKFLNKQKILVCGIVSCMIGGGLFISTVASDLINNATPQLQVYNDYTKYRAKVLDYPMPEYNDLEKYYNKIGLSNNDLELLTKGWYLDYDGMAKMDTLRALSEASKNGNDEGVIGNKMIPFFIQSCISNISGLSFTGIHFLIYISISIVGIICFKVPYSHYVFAFGICLISGYLYLYHIGRFPYRVLYGLDLSACCYLLFSFRYELLHDNALERGKFLKLNLVAMRSLCVVLLLISVQLSICDLHVFPPVDNKNEMRISKHMENCKSSFFVFSTVIKSKYQSNLPYYQNPLLIPSKGFEANVVPFGSWYTQSPFMIEKLSRYHLSNVFSDIINNQNVYVIEAPEQIPKMEEYFNKYYGSDDEIIAYELTKYIGEYHIWQVKRFKR